MPVSRPTFVASIWQTPPRVKRKHSHLILVLSVYRFSCVIHMRSKYRNAKQNSKILQCHVQTLSNLYDGMVACSFALWRCECHNRIHFYTGCCGSLHDFIFEMWKREMVFSILGFGCLFFWFVLVVVGGGGDGFCSFALCDHHCLFCLTYQLNDCENLYVYAVISETKIKVSFMVVILSQINWIFQ